MSRSIRPATTIFLTILGVTALIWVLRGIGLLTGLPGGVLWLFIVLTVGTGVFSGIQGTRR